MSAAAIDRPYTVVVGVSVTSKSPAALEWAAAQAKANHGRLVAVRVLKRHTTKDGSTEQAPQELHGDSVESQLAELEADVAATLGTEHEAECRVLYGGKRKSLLAVAGGADLLVIDAARTPSSSSLLAHRIIAASMCPVVVLPPSLSGEPLSGFSKAGRAMGQAALRAVGTSGRPGYRPPEWP
ncbi:MAG: universal stress protein [Marmoricola sp.]